MTPKQLNKNPVRPIIMVNLYDKLDTDEGESATSKGLSEDSISGTPTRSSEDSISIEIPQVPTVFIKSRHDGADSSIPKPMTSS